MTKKEYEQKVASAVVLVKAMFPFQGDLVAHARINLDDRVRTACVFPSGRILLSPAFIEDMTIAEVLEDRVDRDRDTLLCGHRRAVGILLQH